MEETLGKNEFERQVSQLSQRKESVVKQLEPPSKFEMETSFGENRERLTSKSESIKEENEKDSSKLLNFFQTGSWYSFNRVQNECLFS